ncbi:MAG: cation transporter [Actinobacteria bacterium]|nr:cation transporter [Actinomycetota bacterium]
MKYKTELTGLHCAGCSNLVKMSFEEEGLENVNVDIGTNTAVFDIDLASLSEVDGLLKKIFKDLPGYGYKNIKKL